MSCIYTIYGFADVVNTKCGSKPWCVKPIGYYFRKLDAIDCVKNNFNDIHSGTFNYCCIESISEGLFDDSYSECMWFAWDGEKYVEADNVGIDDYKFEVD